MQLRLIGRVLFVSYMFFFFFKQKTAYEMRISDWSSDVCSSDLDGHLVERAFDPIVGLGLADLQRLGECGMVDFPLAQRRSGDMEKLGQFRVGRAETTERLGLDGERMAIGRAAVDALGALAGRLLRGHALAFREIGRAHV